MFDFATLETESGLSVPEMEALKQEVRADYPRDELLYELHLLRALREASRGRKGGERSTGTTSR